MSQLEDADLIDPFWGKKYILREKSEFMPIIFLTGILFRIIPTAHVCLICATLAAAGCFCAKKPG